MCRVSLSLPVVLNGFLPGFCRAGCLTEYAMSAGDDVDAHERVTAGRDQFMTEHSGSYGYGEVCIVRVRVRQNRNKNLLSNYILVMIAFPVQNFWFALIFPGSYSGRVPGAAPDGRTRTSCRIDKGFFGCHAPVPCIII